MALSNNHFSDNLLFQVIDEFKSYIPSCEHRCNIFMYSSVLDKVCCIYSRYLYTDIIKLNKDMFIRNDIFIRNIDAIEVIDNVAQWNKYINNKSYIKERFGAKETIKQKGICGIDFNAYYFGFEKFNENHPNSGLNELSSQTLMKTIKNKDFIKMLYITLYMKYPCVEQLVKAGFEKIVLSYLRIPKSYRVNELLNYVPGFYDGNSIAEITRLSDGIWKTLINYIYDIGEYIEYVKAINHYKINKNDLERMLKLNIKHDELTELTQILDLNDNKFKGLSLKQLLNYISKTKINQGLKTSTTLSLMVDYISMCKEIGIIPNLTSEHLKKDHDEVTNIYNSLKAEEKDRILKTKFKKRNNHLQKYLYEDERLKVIVPCGALDLFNEGQNNHNCVASYSDRHANGDTDIFFIRKKDALDKSYITIELNENRKEVVQAKYAYNKSVDNLKDKEFISNWLKNCVYDK